MLILAMGHEFAKSSGKTLNDFVSDFDQHKFNKLSQTLKFMTSDQAAEEAYAYLLNEAYKRAQKKFSM